MSNIRNFMNLLEAYTVHDPLGVVARVRELDTAFMTKYTEAKKKGDLDNHDHSKGPFRPPLGAYDTQSHFHLSPCGRCHSPVWQQPCPVCNFYPMGAMDDGIRMKSPEWEERAAVLREKAKKLYLLKIQANGNIAAWYFNNKKNVVAFNTPDKFAHYVQPFVIETLMDDPWPTGEEIWDAYGPKITSEEPSASS